MDVSDLWKQSPELYGMRSVLDGGKLFCGVTEERFAIAGVTYQWPAAMKKLLWSFNFTGIGQLSDTDFHDAAAAWFAEIAAACDRTFEYVTDGRIANILYTRQRLDGPSGVLADMQIPVGNITEQTQLLGRFDDSESWCVAEQPSDGQIDLYRTGLHETLHAMGMGHEPSSIHDPSIEAPIYSRSIRHLQPIDVQELQRRYGPPVSGPVTPPPLAPGSLPVDVVVSQSGKVWKGSIQRTS